PRRWPRAGTGGTRRRRTACSTDARRRNARRPRRRSRRAVRRSQELFAPAFEAQERPDQQTPVLRAADVLVDERLDRAAIEERVAPAAGGTRRRADVVDAVALDPARARRREALLVALAALRRHVARQPLPQQQLAVVGAAEVAGALGAGLVLVDAAILHE